MKVNLVGAIAQSCINFGQNQPFGKLPHTELTCYLDIVSDKIMCKNNNIGPFQVSVWRKTPYIWYKKIEILSEKSIFSNKRLIQDSAIQYEVNMNHVQ